MNASGVGPPSNEVLINSGYVPAPPAGPWLNPPIVSGTTVTLTWEAPAGIPATIYRVHGVTAAGPGLALNEVAVVR